VKFFLRLFEHARREAALMRGTLSAMKPCFTLSAVSAIAVSFLVSACRRERSAATAPEAKKPHPAPDEGAPLAVAGPQFVAMHQMKVQEFTDREGMGRSRMGPRFFEAGKLELADSNGAKWRVEALQLVSLLEHNTPQVYETGDSTSHYFMQAMNRKSKEESSAPKLRDLTDFEEAAMEMVLKNPEVIAVSTQAQDGRARFVGAITAGTSCLKCHAEKKTGDVLGAFTWVLSPLDAPESKAVSMR
jgi:hypothetical protein